MSAAAAPSSTQCTVSRACSSVASVSTSAGAGPHTTDVADMLSRGYAARLWSLVPSGLRQATSTGGWHAIVHCRLLGANHKTRSTVN
jgi:hypothetical protein